jgi:hypothetical protein
MVGLGEANPLMKSEVATPLPYMGSGWRQTPYLLAEREKYEPTVVDPKSSLPLNRASLLFSRALPGSSQYQITYYHHANRAGCHQDTQVLSLVDLLT